MIKCTFLLPSFSNEGVRFLNNQSVFARLFETFGGYTLRGQVHGTYKMADGSRATDTCQEVVVCVDLDRVEELQCMVAEFGRERGQETMYFEESLSHVEFLPSAKPRPQKIPIPSNHGLCAPSTQQPDSPVYSSHKLGASALLPDNPYHLAGQIQAEVNRDFHNPKGYEVGGWLPQKVINILQDAGLHVATYHHKGTVATVIRQK